MLLRYAIRRVRDVALVLILVTFLTTSLTSLIPGNPAFAIYGSQLSPEFVRQFNQEFGLDHNLLVRYWNWIWDALHGNFGVSYATHDSVAGSLARSVPVTAEIAVLSLLIALVVAVPTAMVSAVRQDKTIDRVSTGIASVGFATPPFVSAAILVYVLALRAGWFPTQGWVGLSQGIGQNLLHAAIPVLTLVGVVAPIFIRILRADIVATLSENFVAVARSRGLPEWYVLCRHVLRPASTSLITVAGLAFGSLFGGSIIVETFFSLPGLGLLASQAVQNKDLPILQGVVVCVAVAFVLINSLVDLSYGLVDPRVRRPR